MKSFIAETEEEWMKTHTKLVAQFRGAELYRVKEGEAKTKYRLTYNGRLVAEDRQFKYLNQIMYQIG